MNVQRVFGGFVASVVLCAACGGGGGSNSSPTAPNNYGGGTTTTAANTVIASAGNAFNPNSLTVAKGTDVTFTFESVTHNVTFDNVAGKPADIGNTSGTSVTRNFATAGTFGYQCTLHSGMRGTIVVN
ncbi:MAG: cupredoxin domain-containing protein [Gemmatimonadetes bacterium]|nr:cupredoxin domain-containing protein [Gemmatimonadota bacterium]